MVSPPTSKGDESLRPEIEWNRPPEAGVSVNSCLGGTTRQWRRCRAWNDGELLAGALLRQAFGQEDLEQRLIGDVAAVCQDFEILDHGDRQPQ